MHATHTHALNKHERLLWAPLRVVGQTRLSCSLSPGGLVLVRVGPPGGLEVAALGVARGSIAHIEARLERLRAS